MRPESSNHAVERTPKAFGVAHFILVRSEDVRGESLKSSYPATWRWLRRWSILHCVGLAALVVFTIVGAALDVQVLSWAGLGGGFVFLLLYALPSSQIAFFRCPRCGERFVWGLGFGIFFQSYCAHCRLPKYPDDTDDPQQI